MRGAVSRVAASRALVRRDETVREGAACAG
jgi:hypothetical protein